MLPYYGMFVWGWRKIIKETKETITVISPACHTNANTSIHACISSYDGFASGPTAVLSCTYSHVCCCAACCVELRAGCNLERKEGKAKPPRLTSHQRAIMGKLIEVHAEDYDVRKCIRKGVFGKGAEVLCIYA